MITRIATIPLKSVLNAETNMASQGIHTLSVYGKANVDGAERKARLRIQGISAILN